MRGVVRMAGGRIPSSPIQRRLAGEVRSHPLSRARVMEKASLRRPGPLVSLIRSLIGICVPDFCGS